MGEDVIGGRVSLVAEDGERENFHRSVRALPAARGHAGRITCRYDIAGHSLNSRLCRVPEWSTEQEVRIRHYADLYGNPCTRVMLPAGRSTLRFGASALVPVD
jgi:hypothetical protein